MTGAALFEWLSQPSTLKAIILLAGLAGLKWQPDRLMEILQAAGILYAGVSAFYDQQPRKPIPPLSPISVPSEATGIETHKKEDHPLTEERFRQLLAEAKAKKPAA